jgi:hypothetical protein
MGDERSYATHVFDHVVEAQYCTDSAYMAATSGRVGGCVECRGELGSSSSSIAKRAMRPQSEWLCRPCSARRNALARTFEERSAAAKRAAARIPPHVRSERARRVWWSRPQEERDELMRRLMQGSMDQPLEVRKRGAKRRVDRLSPEQIVEATNRMREALAQRTPEERSAFSKSATAAWLASTTPAQRSDRGRKAHATAMANQNLQAKREIIRLERTDRCASCDKQLHQTGRARRHRRPPPWFCRDCFTSQQSAAAAVAREAAR